MISLEMNLNLRERISECRTPLLYEVIEGLIYDRYTFVILHVILVFHRVLILLQEQLGELAMKTPPEPLHNI